MTDKELIKEEIESYKESMKCLWPHSDFRRGQITAYNHIIQFIDSLPEEPASKDLEEAANFYANTHMEWFDSEGNPHVMPAFKAGAEWQKQKMMKYSTEIHAHLDGIDSNIQRMTSGNYMHNAASIRLSVEIIKQRLEKLGIRMEK